jgi:hypothetical protein
VGATAMGTNVGAPEAQDTKGLPGVTVGVPVVGALAVVVGLTLAVVGVIELGANVGTPKVGDTEGLQRVIVGVPVVGALAVVVGVPVTGLTLGDPGVTAGVFLVGATELGANVGAPVAGDTKGLPGFTVGVPVVGALAVVGVPVTKLTLGDPGVKVEFLWWEPLIFEPMWGHQWMETQRGFQDSVWVFLWWEH